MRPRGRIVWKLSLGVAALLACFLVVFAILHGGAPTPRAVELILWAVAAAATSVALITILWHLLVGRPVKELTGGMQALTGEDASYRLAVKGEDEFARVAQSFNQMAERIDATMQGLVDTRNYLEGIVESSGDIIITVNPRGYVYTFNRGAENALGYKRTEVIGRSAEMLFSDPAERSRAIQLLRGKENVANFETHLKAKTGEVLDVMLTLSRLRDKSGETIGSFGIGKDVTEAHRMQQRLVHAERFAAIGQALAGLQHSLKNMLNALKGGAYMVGIGLSKDDRPLLEEGWGMVQKGIENLTRMSTHMLSYVREWKPEWAEVDVAAMVTEIEEIFRPTAEDQGVALDVDSPTGSPHVTCDGRLVHSAVMDILSNALDACKEREYGDSETPAIAIRARPSDQKSFFVLSVRDNGCGMSPEVSANVFTPFFTTKRSLGTGLGLALTARTIRLHGGEIEVTSEENVGSEFRILLPLDGPNTHKEQVDGQESAGRR